MDQAVVRTLCRELLGRKFIAIPQTGTVRLSQSYVARGVLVKQGIEEEHSAAGNRRGMGHERNFAQSSRAFICADQPLKYLLASACAGLYDLSFFETHLNAVNQGSLIGEWFCRRDRAFGAIPMRSSEDLFGGQVRNAVQAITGSGPPAQP